MYLIMVSSPSTGGVLSVVVHHRSSTLWTKVDELMNSERDYRRFIVWDAIQNVELGDYRVNIPPIPPVDLTKATKWVEERIIQDVNMEIGMIDMIKLVRAAFPGLGLVQARDVVKPLYTL
jgi:hypothetical protein